MAVSFLIGWWYLNYSRIPGHYSSETTNEPIEEQPLQYVTISVSLYEQSHQWIRDYATDLPYYSSTISYSISNYGTATATNIQYTIHMDGSLYLEDTISTLSSHASYSDQFSIQVKYDNQRQISLTASCSDSSDTSSFILHAIFPRSPSSEIMKLYITPNDPIIKSLVRDIQQDKFPLIPDWIAIRDWVGNNIEYPPDDADDDGEPDYDYIKHGQWEYWQLPRETLFLGTGDCEDYAILLCSLYRAIGFKTNEVYVVLGNKGESYHGWVKVYIEVIGWQNIESQENGLSTFIGDFLWLSGYNAKYNFNDVYFTSVSP